MRGQPARAITRRSFAATLAAGLGFASEGLEIPAKDWAAISDEISGGVLSEQRYRADAQVLLLGMCVLRRENVGGGSVTWRESGVPGKPFRLLQFTGYSVPERAAGLNRLGLIRELRREVNGAPEFRYFGLMSAASEESADAARRALHSTAKSQVYSAIDGSVVAGEARSVTAHFVAPVVESPANLIGLARNSLGAGESALVNLAEGSGMGTFLQTLAEALVRPRTAETRYVYCGRIYRMHLTCSADAKATETFRARGLDPGSQIIRIAGRVCRESGGKDTEFRLWIPSPPARPLPLRIEYQPKSYLRLVFEAERT